MKKVLITVGVLAVLGTVGFIAYKNGLFGGKASDAELKNLVDTFSKNGKDTFEGRSFDNVKATFGKLSSAEVKKLTEFGTKKESSLSASEKMELNYLMNKALK
jgi:hypothetical protein